MFDLRCHCAEYRTRWIEEEPSSMHRYRVECDDCYTFIAWGTQEQLMEHGANHHINLITWAEQQANPKPTLDKYFDD